MEAEATVKESLYEFQLAQLSVDMLQGTSQPRQPLRFCPNHTFSLACSFSLAPSPPLIIHVLEELFPAISKLIFGSGLMEAMRDLIHATCVFIN
jgi:hypothetical protein